jgi:hypothetical protein
MKVKIWFREFNENYSIYALWIDLFPNIVTGKGFFTVFFRANNIK